MKLGSPDQTIALPTTGLLTVETNEMRFRARTSRLLRALNREGRTVDTSKVSIRCDAEELQKIVSSMEEEFGPEDFAGFKFAFESNLNEVPGLSAFWKARDFSKRVESEWVLSLMDEGSLTVHFQPIVDIAYGKVIGHECLLRAFDASKHEIKPAEIFATARELGIVDRFDRLARSTAFRNAAVSGGVGSFFVNIDPVGHVDVAGEIAATVEVARQWEIDIRRITLEITGIGKFEHRDQLRRIVEGYRSYGFNIAFDDLEPGYMGVHHVHELRPDYVKLDMRLTRSVQSDNLRQTIVRHLFERSRQDGALPIVKGIETTEEWIWCHRNGAVFAQGFFIGVPKASPSNDAYQPKLMKSA